MLVERCKVCGKDKPINEISVYGRCEDCYVNNIPYQIGNEVQSKETELERKLTLAKDRRQL